MALAQLSTRGLNFRLFLTAKDADGTPMVEETIGNREEGGQNRATEALLKTR